MSLQLPPRPHLDVLKRQAKSALRIGRLLFPDWQLADAQRALAAGYGYSSWPNLKDAVRATSVQRWDSSDASAHRSRITGAAGGAADGPFAGTWVSQRSSGDRVALAVASAPGGFSLCQVATGADAKVRASALMLHSDGRNHALPFGDGLHMCTTWRGARVLESKVSQRGLEVARGTYEVSVDGLTLTVENGTTRLVFDRVAAGGPVVTSRAGAPTTSLRPRRRRKRSAALLLVAIASIGATGCGARVHGGSTAAGRIAADVAAIGALNRHDIAAALATDVEAVVSQWTDDFVLIPPGAPFIRGKAANAALIRNAKPQAERFEPTGYEVDFEEIIVSGEYAFAWGRFTASARPRAGGSETRSSGTLFRVYQRQLDGRWLMHRTMASMAAR